MVSRQPGWPVADGGALFYTTRMDLAGKKAVVTGGGRGIGKAVARALCEAGASVLVASRTTTQVEAVAAELREAGHDAHFAKLDVTDEKSVRALAAAANDKLGQVDILVNNAGIATSAPVKAQTLEEWNHVMAVNATGTFLCTQAFVTDMTSRGWGRVVNIASIASRMGAPYISAYTASKHAVLGFTRAVAAEVAKKGVTVNAVCPGYVDTEMTIESVERVMKQTKLGREDALTAILRTASQSRLITPREVAFVVASLCNEEARGINGQAVVVDGGGLLA